MMTQREVIRGVLTGQVLPYVPWSYGFTKVAKARMQETVKYDIDAVGNKTVTGDGCTRKLHIRTGA